MIQKLPLPEPLFKTLISEWPTVQEALQWQTGYADGFRGCKDGYDAQGKHHFVGEGGHTVLQALDLHQILWL